MSASKTLSPLTEKLSKGAEILPQNLVALRHLSSLLPIHKQKKIFNDLAGVHTSNIRGRGVDFSEVRGYQAGDDIRTMDWRVTARTGQAHIKVFREERERPVIIVADMRSSMFFGTKHALKSVLCADLAALFSWSALDNGDRIGALLFNDTDEVDLRPKSGRKQVMHLLHELSEFKPQPSSEPTVEPRSERFAQMCRHLRRVTKPGSAIYFISDWSGFDEESERQLYQLSRHNDVIALNVYDSMEAELPPPGSYPLTDGVNKHVLQTFNQQQRNHHQQIFQQHLDNLKSKTLKLAIPCLSLTANGNVMTELRQGLGLTQLGGRR